MADVAARDRSPSCPTVFAWAAGLGLLAFAADAVDGVAGQVMVALTSSGFAWGLAAFLAGRSAIGARRAAAVAAVLLTSATVLYYLLVLVVSRRWSGGYLEDGEPADAQGLRSVAIFAAVWVLGSLVGGPALGLLGYSTRSDSTWRASCSAGVACGLLSAEGWYLTFVAAPPWRLVTDAAPFHASFVRGVVISEAIMVVLPVAVLAWLATVHRLWRVWPVLVASMVASAITGVLLWHVLGAVATEI